MTLASVLGYLQPLLAKLAKTLVCTALLLLVGCSSSSQSVDSSSTIRESSNASFTSRPTIKQVSAPTLIQQLAPWLDRYAPQIQIQQPKANQVFDDTIVSVVLRVQDLPIYKDEVLQLGPHVELLLDNQPYGSVYDLEQPIVLKDLTPGTHTIRAFATRPWDESFKNEGAYAQTTFHVFTETDENFPTATQPLLTYGGPIGTYGAEPVLLDFYLTDAPLHQIAQDNPMILDWRVRYTVNGDSLILDDWESIYIEGLQPGKNWVQLTLVDDEGNPIEGVFNNTVRLIEYDPELNDSLAKIVREDLTLADVGRIVDPSYEPPVPEVIVPVEPLPMEDTAVDDGAALENDELENARAVPEAPEYEVTEPEVIEVTEPEVIEPEITEPEITESAPRESLDSPDNKAIEEDAPKATSLDDQLSESAQEPEFVQEPVQEIEPVQETDRADVLEEDASLNLEAATGLETVPSEASPKDEAAEPTDISDDIDEAATPSAEASPAKERRYLQRLYDYRDRSMQTYDRDR
ncbi:hypothetical protein IQ260_12980 [Leptolyngbya cf. ectocarpi LEGE 11479]|uniref:Uncharacterized protein n=1 Tax=Leptolyngbya cf. ectocarpi LEGE 11479 TaxID=1828722 RepID=A0A928ZU94_LEPEC|nr:hypothetical protein [Leptolyngbya ectocarpi]MBE9067572.1 hypothetical protein [Leptolyngbya cf. ectocarpi LEGE 11479]